VDQQFAAATGDGVRGSDPTAADGAGLPDQEEVAPDLDAGTDALSSDAVAPEDETAADAAPESEASPDQPDADAIRQELEQLRAEKAERDHKELEARQAQQRAEAERRQQEQIAQFDRAFATFDEYEDGLGQKAKALAAQIAATALQIEQANQQRLQQEADYHGRTASALIQVLQAEAPETLDRIKPLVKQAMALNSPEEQGGFVSQIQAQVKAATEAKDREIATLKAQLKKQELQKHARGLADGATATGPGDGAPSGQAPSGEPTSFSDYFDRQVRQAMSGAVR
jgi:hypothetical protein